MLKTFKNLVMTVPLVYPRTGLKARFYRVKYCLRGLLHARCSKEWSDLLQQPELAAVTRHHPYIFASFSALISTGIWASVDDSKH
jgi:uncharacterized protein VirK/YbjX